MENDITLHDVMNIRASFMALRDEYVDPPEMIKVRKLRCFEFLTNEEILAYSNGSAPIADDDSSEVNYRSGIKDSHRFEMHDQKDSVHSSCLGACSGPGADLTNSQ